MTKKLKKYQAEQSPDETICLTSEMFDRSQLLETALNENAHYRKKSAHQDRIIDQITKPVHKKCKSFI